jgi:hypothetical protein
MKKRGESQFPLPHIEAGIPPASGTQPIPPGTMRFQHYTWGKSVPGIQAEGLKRSISEEKFAHGGTESPQVFATAGSPSERDLQDISGGDKHLVEGFAHINQLDIGGMYNVSKMNEEQLGAHARDVESRRSTITFHGDVPPEQILAVHAPWHGTARYLRESPEMEKGVMAGDYDYADDENLTKALNVHKTALAAKVMLGGKLQGKSYEDEGLVTSRSKKQQ